MDVSMPKAIEDEVKKHWEKPVVRQIRAGDAEAGFPGAREDAPFVQAS